MKEENSSIGRTTFTYDMNRKVVSITRPDGTVVPYTQDALGNAQPPVDHEGTSANITYDSAGAQTEGSGAEGDGVS